MDGDEEDYSEEDDFLEGKKSDSENRLGLIINLNQNFVCIANMKYLFEAYIFELI